MKHIPSPDVYEQELVYWPYKDSLAKVQDIISTRTPIGGKLLDLMCGPGYLLGKIQEKRGDLFLDGLDIDEKYIAHAKKDTLV